MADDYDFFVYRDTTRTFEFDDPDRYEIRQYDEGTQDNNGIYKKWLIMRGGKRFDRSLKKESYDSYYRGMDDYQKREFEERKTKRHARKSQRTHLSNEGQETNLSELLFRLEQVY